MKNLYSLITTKSGKIYTITNKSPEEVREFVLNVLGEFNQLPALAFLERDNTDIGDFSYSTVDEGYYLVRNY